MSGAEPKNFKTNAKIMLSIIIDMSSASQITVEVRPTTADSGI